MLQKKGFLALFGFVLMINFVPDVEAKIYIDDEYDFWIEYPDNWYFEDTKVNVEAIPGVNSGAIIFPSFRDGVYWWEHFVSVTLHKESAIAVNYEDQEFLDFVGNELKKGCEIATFDFEGYECFDHEILKKEIVNVNGRTMYQITDSWTEKYPDGETISKVSIITDFVIENDLWQIDSIMIESKYEDGIPTTEEIIQSFRFLDKSEINEPKIPEWIRNNAHWWAENQISDDEFISGLQFLINNEILIVPHSTQESTVDTNEIPSWIKNNAGWWADGLIDDNSFIEGIQWMIKEGIIKVS